MPSQQKTGDMSGLYMCISIFLCTYSYIYNWYFPFKNTKSDVHVYVYILHENQKALNCPGCLLDYIINDNFLV